MTRTGLNERDHPRNRSGEFRRKGAGETPQRRQRAGLAGAPLAEPTDERYDREHDPAFAGAQAETVAVVPNSCPAVVHAAANEMARRFAAELAQSEPQLDTASRRQRIGVVLRRAYREELAANAAAAAARVASGQITGGADVDHVWALGRFSGQKDLRRRTPARIARRDYQEMAAVLSASPDLTRATSVSDLSARPCR